MGALEGLSGAQPNGLLPGGAGGVTRVLDGERWAKAEARTAELIECIQPTWLSEERRNAVANYVQRLIMQCFSCRVFMFGSVPLKTYLPDGDIDLTAMSENENLKDTWATRVRDILESEERNANAEFHVKEVQYIQAEVKIIKCLVENIVVDISFNQVGGLCTLCFLDEIDHLINQSHLFKRSIILIKAWCYYESRILGAHHGLISTYALETLVLYIFHAFNNTFAGPLEVLYRFLEIFSNFDWDKYGVSLWGPLPLSSLPDMTVDAPRKDSVLVKVNFRDRQFSNTRNHRGNYNCDRSDHSDREGSWISPKARAAGRSHGRSHTEKSNSRLDRSVGTENRADRLWDSHRREPVALGEVRNNSYGSSNSSHSSASMANGMYPLPIVGSNGVCPMGDAVPSVMMLHPYDEGAGDGSLDEQLEFGFFGPTRPSGMSETQQPTDGNPVQELYHQRSVMHQGDSLRTSLDLPSPHVRRGL